MALIALFVLAALPQALGRTDYPHVIFGVPLATAALVASTRPWIACPVLVVSVVPWFVRPPEFASMQLAAKAWTLRDDANFTTPARQAVVDLVQDQTAPDETVFVGCRSHTRTMSSPVDVLYLAKRRNATRYVQFDPGTVSSAQGQAEMIADLERTRPRLALLEPVCEWDEPNASMTAGSRILDHYLRSHYTHASDTGEMEVWVATNRVQSR